MHFKSSHQINTNSDDMSKATMSWPSSHIMFYNISFLGRENLQQQPIRVAALPCQGTDQHILPSAHPQPKLPLSPRAQFQHPNRPTCAVPHPEDTLHPPSDSLWFLLSPDYNIILLVPQSSLLPWHPEPRPEAETGGAAGEVLQWPVGPRAAQALPGHVQSQ